MVRQGQPHVSRSLEWLDGTYFVDGCTKYVYSVPYESNQPRSRRPTSPSSSSLQPSSYVTTLRSLLLSVSSPFDSLYHLDPAVLVLLYSYPCTSIVETCQHDSFSLLDDDDSSCTASIPASRHASARHTWKKCCRRIFHSS